MLHSLHDIHLIFHLLVQDAIFYKASLLQFLGGIGHPVEFTSHFVHDRESSLANRPNAIVLARAGPLPTHGVLYVPGPGRSPDLLRRTDTLSLGSGVYWWRFPWRLEYVYGAAVGLRRCRRKMAGKVVGNLGIVGVFVLGFAAGDADAKGQVANLLV